MELNGAVAIVTGGARGIGRGIAYELAKQGARIAIADLPAVTADRDETVAGIKALGSDAMAVDCDVTDAAQVQAMTQAVLGAWGQIDILVNNAGVIRIGPVMAFSEADWDLVMDVNLKGTFLCSKAVLPHMMQRQGGKIINLSSIAGKRGRAGTACYSATKFGVIGLTQSLASEMGQFNITANAICPGEVETHMWTDVLAPAMGAMSGVPASEAFDQWIQREVPLKRPQTIEDMGQAVVYLCQADNVTGVALNVSGGTEMH